MDFTKLSANLTAVLSSLSWTERQFIRALVTTAAALSTVLVTIQYIGLTQLRPGEPEAFGMTSYDLTDFWLRLRVAVALIVNLASICRFRPKGFLVSVGALSWVVAEYTLWFVWSRRFKEALGIGHLPDPQVAGLYKAVRWDVVVLGSTLVLFAWAIKTLVSVLRFSREHPRQQTRLPSEQSS